MIFLIFKWFVIGFSRGGFSFLFVLCFYDGRPYKRGTPEGYDENCKRFLTMLKDRR